MDEDVDEPDDGVGDALGGNPTPEGSPVTVKKGKAEAYSTYQPNFGG